MLYSGIVICELSVFSCVCVFFLFHSHSTKYFHLQHNIDVLLNNVVDVVNLLEKDRGVDGDTEFTGSCHVLRARSVAKKNMVTKDATVAINKAIREALKRLPKCPRPQRQDGSGWRASKLVPVLDKVSIPP